MCCFKCRKNCHLIAEFDLLNGWIAMPHILVSGSHKGVSLDLYTIWLNLNISNNFVFMALDA